MLRQLPLFFLLALFMAGVSLAQSAPTSANGTTKQTTYFVQLTEYRLNKPLDPSLSSAHILEMIAKKDNNSGFEAVETVRLSTLSGTESMVQFGRGVNVTVGKSAGRGGETVRNVQAIDVGTIVRLTATPENGSVSLNLTYESSKLDGSGENDTPELLKTQISTIQMLELGQPTLVGSSSTASTSVIVATVTGK